MLRFFFAGTCSRPETSLARSTISGPLPCPRKENAPTQESEAPEPVVRKPALQMQVAEPPVLALLDGHVVHDDAPLPLYEPPGHAGGYGDGMCRNVVDR